MKTPLICPYLMFDGNCEEAMTFYKDVLGGDLDIMRFGDQNKGEPKESDKRVIHAALRNEALSFMASDTMMNDTDFKIGNNVQMSLVSPDTDSMRKFFEGLSKGGKVDMPLQKQFWGDEYGQLTDKFGVKWMVNIGDFK